MNASCRICGASAGLGRPRRGVVYKALSPLIQQVRDYVYKDISKGEMRKVDPQNTLYSIFELLFSYFTLNEEAAEIFFEKGPYSKDMLQRRKAHLTTVIRRLLAPEDPGRDPHARK